MKKRTAKSQTYVGLMNFICAFPGCISGFNVEGHHIVPISIGGEDAFWNIISLCSKCHRHNKLHSRWMDIDVELYTWKCSAELQRFGFYLDEKKENFKLNLKNAVLLCHQEDVNATRKR